MADFNSPVRKKSKTQDDAFKTPVMRRLLGKSQPVSSPAFEIPPSPCLKQLGFGTGVKVLLFERSPRSGGPRSPWAIKKLNKAHAGLDIAERLEKEAAILKTLNHPNIVGYRGFKRSSDGSQILALETKAKCRSLFDILEEIQDEGLEEMKPFAPKHILFVAKEIAKALHYLHTEKHLLHGDLKAANILVDGDFEAVKLCDFGVTIPLGKDGIADPKIQYVGTEPWSAPEVIEENDITAKADIYSLGCVIFEMLALDTPHANKLPPLDDSIEMDENAGYDTTEYDESMGTRPELPDYFKYDASYEQALSIFYACTSEDPDQRPSAAKLIELLELNDNENQSNNR